MSEQFSILIDSRSRFETGEAGGAWVSMPATREQLHAAMQSVGITADNSQDFFLNGYANTKDCPFNVPLEVIQRGSVDELNYLGKLLEMQRDEDKAKFAAAVTLGEYAGNLKDLINLAQNLDCYGIYPTVQSEEDYGHYLVDELDELELPEEAKKYFMYENYGRDAAINNGGRFTDQGYVFNNKNSFTEWYDGQNVPLEYHIMSYPQSERADPEKSDFDAIAAARTATVAAEQPEAKPIIPLVISAKDPAGRMKEITDKLEDGIRGIFDSEKYAEYLKAMSKFHNYSFNNTILIAMQGGTLVKGYSQWEKEFERHVKPGEKGIKIIAPAPFKVKQEVKKLDPQTRQPLIGADGKPVMEEKEVTIPAYKVVTVFDVSQTEGKELPSIGVNALTGDVEHFKDVLSALEKVSPVPIGFEDIKGSAHGYYSLADKRIAIQENMSQLQTLKTAIHEIAHAKLHDIDLNAPKEEREKLPDQRTREVQAESVAYTVCQHYGLDTSDYSFGYVAGWSTGREMEELKSSLETIRSTAAEIINGIDAQITELQKDQEQEQEAVYRLDSGEYLHVQASEAGYDYTLYDKNYQALDGGQLDNPDLPLTAARDEILALQDRKSAETQVVKIADFEKGKEAAEQDTFTIYQLKREDATRDYRFEPYDRLQAAGLAVDPAHYEPVYSGSMTPGMTLENIYTRFNIDHPQDFKGHSLSVSDVVVVQQGGQSTAHYVDSFGYKTVPEFLQPENYLKAAEQSTEQNYNMIDGMVNNTPTVGELEAKAKAGEVISLTDLATAIQAEKGRGREEKPSIRAQLKQYKEQTADRKKAAKTKSHEMEV